MSAMRPAFPCSLSFRSSQCGREVSHLCPTPSARAYRPRPGIGKLLCSHLDLPGSTWNNGQQLIGKAMSAFGAICLVSYLVFGLVGGLYYALGTNPESKRSTFPLFLVVAVALLIAAVALSADSSSGHYRWPCVGRNALGD